MSTAQESDNHPAAKGNVFQRSWLLLSCGTLPLMLLVLSISTLTSPARTNDESSSITLTARYIRDVARVLNPGDARTQLADQPLSLYYNTHLSEAPVWFGFDVPAAPQGHSSVIEFPSRHALTLECWNAITLAPYGRIERNSESVGLLKPRRAGFILMPDVASGAMPVLCRATFMGPAHATVLAWSASGFGESLRQSERDAGLLNGGILVLAAFAFVTAVLNREKLYLIFAVWLVGNLRLAQLSIGTDAYWFGEPIALQWLPAMRELTIAAYFNVTYVLFGTLFAQDLPGSRLHKSIEHGAQGLGAVLFILALTCPYRIFLPAMWVIATLGTIGVMYLLAQIIRNTRSRVAISCAVALGVALCSNSSEVLAAALGTTALVGTFNSVTGALGSSFLAALAIAEQIRIERMQRMAIEGRYRKTYETVPIGLFTIDKTGALMSGNPVLRELLELPVLAEGMLLGRCFDAHGWRRFTSRSEVGESFEIEIRSAARSGATKWFLVKAARSNEYIEGSLQDITLRVQATERLNFLAENDALTGASNRRGIESLIDLEFDGTTPCGFVPFALAYLDLDRFKLVNDLFGHRAGDEVLRQITRLLCSTLGKQHALGRIGGDEFVLLIRESNLERAAALCRQLIEHIERDPFVIERRAVKVRASIGLLEVYEPMIVSDAISAADGACRQAKRHIDHLCIYSQASGALLERTRALNLMEHLGGELFDAGLFLEMQPILSMHSPDSSLDFEVLLRMREPGGAVVPPRQLITAVEENGNISEVDRWVLRRTLEWITEHEAQLVNTRFVCVNLSGASLNDEHFVDSLIPLLTAYPAAARKLCIEITEGVALHDLDHTRRFIEQVRARGAKVALDDFGAGYTSFSYLKDLPADALKIDGAFVQSMASSPANAAIVEAMISLARNLGMRCVAEWVEDEQTLQLLAHMGVDYVQGFAIARAQSPEHILAARSATQFIIDHRIHAFVRRWENERNAFARCVPLAGESDVGAFDDC